MSANISIKEGGQARSFGPVAALMVQGNDGQYYPWVPESERQLDTLSVTKNGVYQAKKLGVYGWRSFSVNVPTDQGVTGKDPTTGQQVAVGVDPTTGELTETVVPVRIEVTTLPTKTTYVDGETIEYNGMVVTAYYADGTEYRKLSEDELILPQKTAVYTEKKQTYEITDDGVDVSGLDDSTKEALSRIHKPIVVTNRITITGNDRVFAIESDSPIWVLSKKDEYGEYCSLFMLDEPKIASIEIGGYSKDVSVQESKYWTVWIDRGDGTRFNSYLEINQMYRNPNKGIPSTLSFLNLGSYRGWNPPPFADSANGNYYSQYYLDQSSIGDAAAFLLGNGIPILPDDNSIPVMWSRPSDGAVLETSFKINVTSAGGD